MQVVLIVAQSLDGFITRHDAPGAGWASAADQKWFRSCLPQFDAQVMARSTYETVRDSVRRHSGPTDPVRLIMTRRPHDFTSEQIEGRLEFSAHPPPTLLARLSNLGVERCALLGGATAHDAFLAAGLVDEIWITIEPRLFGAGTPVVKATQDRELILLSHDRLPDSDSLVLKYRVQS